MFRYNHLQDILDKLLLERPKNPLKNFEKYSMMLKRTYIDEEVNFERVFVDNINRNYCFKSLQMYKVIYRAICNNHRNLYSEDNLYHRLIFSSIFMFIY